MWPSPGCAVGAAWVVEKVECKMWMGQKKDTRPALAFKQDRVSQDKEDERGAFLDVLDGSVLTESSDQKTYVEKTLSYLGRATRCSAAGLLTVDGRHGRVALYCARPVDDLFLRTVQKRLVSSYQVCVGPATAAPVVERVVYGDAISGPYEPPRSLLSLPILIDGRVIGMLGIASVFAEVFSSQDMCTLSAVAAQLPLALGQDDANGGRLAALESGPAPGPESTLSREQVESRVRHHVTSICGLARLWQAQGESDLPDVLRKDLDTIARSALQIRELLSR